MVHSDQLQSVSGGDGRGGQSEFGGARVGEGPAREAREESPLLPSLPVPPARCRLRSAACGGLVRFPLSC